MPGSAQTPVEQTLSQASVPAEPELSAEASLSHPGAHDWSELGRRVLAAALRKARQELAQRDELPARVVPLSRREDRR